MRLKRIRICIGSLPFVLSSVILPCKHVCCFQDMMEETEETTGKGEEKAKAILYIQPLTVEEVSEKEDENKNGVKEKKKKKKNVGKR